MQRLNKKEANFWSNRLHKLGTPKVLHTEEQSGPKNKPVFTKATQVKSDRLAIWRWNQRSRFNIKHSDSQLMVKTPHLCFGKLGSH